MFELYDRLIEGIPSGIGVESVCSGSEITAVCADGNTGLCETVVDQRIPMSFESSKKYDLKALAGFSKSWNFIEASIGMAAICCYYNDARKLEENGCRPLPVRRNPYRFMKRALVNRRAALIDRSALLEDVFSSDAQLSVLTERPAAPSEYPFAAADFILGEQDAVFADGRAFVRKRLPHILTCANGVVLYGLGVPASEISGVRAAYGLSVLDHETVQRLVFTGAPLEKLLPFLGMVHVGGEVI